MPLIVNYFSGDFVTAYLLAALITWLFHSSIAAVLLLVTLAGRGFIPPELGIVLVLGVNLGSSVIAPLLTRQPQKHADANQHDFERDSRQRFPPLGAGSPGRRFVCFLLILELGNVSLRHGAT